MVMMTREPGEGWHYDHWFTTPKQQRASLRGALRLTILCVLLAAGSIVATLIPG
jgi:hypothetical protein